MAFLDTGYKKKSLSITLLLLCTVLLLICYIGFRSAEPPIEDGILINLGSTDFGSGTMQANDIVKISPKETSALEIKQTQATTTEIESIPKEEQSSKDIVLKEKLLTSKFEESLKIEQAKIEEERLKTDALVARNKKLEEAKQQAQVNAERAKKEALAKAENDRRDKKEKLDALMGGLNQADGSSRGGDGDDEKTGDKGVAQGNPYATSYYGNTGSGISGYGLNGRSLVKSGQVLQECNESGKVVVKIVVDKNGNVVSAVPGVRGTTNTNPCLLEPAKKTALLYSWNFDADAPTQQIGFIVINFKLGA